jgi:predicted ribosomally synthesized peptide with SipW-like signal peptide
MKKIAMSLATIAMIATMAVGATSAYFNNTQQSPGDTFSMGTLKMTVTQPSWQHVTFTGLKPGDTVRKWVTIQNAGSLDIASLNVKAVNLKDPKGLLGQVDVSVIGWDNSNTGNVYYTPNWNNGGESISNYLGTAKDVFSTNAPYVQGTVPSILHQGDSDEFVFDFTVPTSLTNSFQGASASFDLQFVGEQSHVSSSYN